MRVIGFGVVAAVCIVTTFAIIVYQQINSTGLYRTEYEGKIVDKSLTIRESMYGSRVARRLLIESKSGERFEVAPSETVYERAQKGMWIRSSRKSGVELSWSETEWTPVMESR